ncbi:MAG: DUF5131 family protein [Moorea sp. SIO1G6]|uniref:DUF5131 family protein n=1 Tax=unclassified Moorena TaxID=2683338 RepID=UPI0013BB6BFC|nr:MULTISPECIES: DUF5131 family protein [unclassified Moorena]NEQ07194.1 DUF5131 family protein [Moorena sp. SIO4E2]NEQ12537.1 DUF5131 family protein [Moorena sp. SIO3E2]NES81193.1 DUF5131 family protein [Moorena sp. SIO2B7]NET69197.1 DUF5131 family protein [Moorena sp. SIO1G6]
MECVDVTDNIIVAIEGGWWCEKISAGCAHCYAERINQNQFFGGNQLSYLSPPPALRLRHDILASWQRQRKKKRHFVASMTDIFGQWVPREWHIEMLDAMVSAPKQIFMLLTKRPHIMGMAIQEWLKVADRDYLPTNIWVGCTIENQAVLIPRLSDLVQIPAHKHWIVCEPLLEKIENWGNFLSSLDLVIIGGETGHNARICDPNWISEIIANCKETHPSPAVFVKQLGSNCPLELADPKGSNPQEWPASLHVREFPDY